MLKRDNFAKIFIFLATFFLKNFSIFLKKKNFLKIFFEKFFLKKNFRKKSCQKDKNFGENVTFKHICATYRVLTLFPSTHALL